MTLGRKGLTSGAIKGLIVCCALPCTVCWCFIASTLLWMAVLCTAIQSSVPELTGRRTVSKQSSPLPCQRCLVITGRQRGI
ncbi:unnamed protein product, partial [Staurois parvus]